MIFDVGREHFIGYQKATEAAANLSTPERMSAYVTAKSTARRPRKGDVIWLLARVGEDSPVRCRFIYAFVVDKISDRVDGKTWFVGERGLWMPEADLVSGMSWFKELFETMGRGGTSIRAIDQDMVATLRGMYGDQDDASDAIAALEKKAEEEGWKHDAMVYRAIKVRRGQTEFRNKLIEVYEGRCCISGCRVESLLEAAHIRPHALEPNYDLTNGILLRADLHTLFDLHLLAIDEYFRVHLSQKVGDAYYKGLVDKVGRANPPTRSAARPNADALRERMVLFQRE